jgi:hypothetical protein
MVDWKNAFHRESHPRQLEKLLLWILCHVNPSYRAAVAPGSYTSSLLDLRNIEDIERYDCAELWEFVNLRQDEQRSYFEALLAAWTDLNFPTAPTDDRAYYSNNGWFSAADAFTLTAIMQRERPAQIIEVGSGFSSAAMLDARRHLDLPTNLTFIEPSPERLLRLIEPAQWSAVTLIQSTVQEVPIEIFDTLNGGDILFIDSSHVAKVGSDVPWLLLRILPRLKAGVFVHFHDIFYPHSYPRQWLQDGICWNESLMLRAFLIGNPRFRVLAFNALAQHAFPELFEKRLPMFLAANGQSLWLYADA